jgi:hypothetical protein
MTLEQDTRESNFWKEIRADNARTPVWKRIHARYPRVDAFLKLTADEWYQLLTECFAEVTAHRNQTIESFVTAFGAECQLDISPKTKGGAILSPTAKYNSPLTKWARSDSI